MKNKARIFVALVLIIAIGSSIWGIYSTFSGSGLSRREKAEIARMGMPGKATLLSVERTGNIVNSIHQYKFSFRIQPDSGAAFVAYEKKLLDPIYMPQVKTGMQIPAYISRDGSRKVLLLWEKAGIGEAF